MNKGQGIIRRLGYALQGLEYALRTERSLRTQFCFALVAIVFLLWLRPGWVWSGMIAAAIALVLILELLNTALENLADGLHPQVAEFVRHAKDCAAGAVLVASVLSLVLFVFMVADQWQNVLFRLGL